MGRRGESIFKRKDGRWEARVMAYRDNGKTVYRSLYGRSYTEVRLKKEEYCRAGFPSRKVVQKSMATLAGLAESWLNAIRGSVKESSYTRYYRIVHSYLIPSLGERPPETLDGPAVSSFREELLKTGGRRRKGLSEKTVFDILSVLKTLLFYARARGCACPNPALFKCPRTPRREIEVLPREVVDRFEEALLSSKEEMAAGLLLALHTGIRIGELCGLKWEDIDFKKRTVRIRRTVERIADLDPAAPNKTKVILGPTKTGNARREIPLPEALADFLSEKRGAPGCFLLTGQERCSEPHTLYVRYERFLRRNGLAHCSFHALRHTFATRGIEAGFDAKSLSELLGHADVATTMRCYVHSSAEQKRKQMEFLFGEKARGRKYSEKRAGSVLSSASGKQSCGEENTRGEE